MTSSAHGRARRAAPSARRRPARAGSSAAPQTRAAASRATSRSSNGILPAGELLARLGAAAGDHDDVAGPGVAERPLDRRAPVELDLELAERAGGDLGGDREPAPRSAGCRR